MKIGIFGGSFNPPHKMHEEIAKELLEKKYVDEIIFVPTGMKYEYKYNLLQNEIREEFLKIITSKNKNFSLSTFEFQEEVVYTYETLDYFQKKYPKDEIFFICGADNLSYIDKWERGTYILKNYPILVIQRDTNTIEEIQNKYKEYQKNIIWTNIKPQSISSTEIRKKIKEHEWEELSSYLDKDILEIIKTKKYYQENL